MQVFDDSLVQRRASVGSEKRVFEGLLYTVTVVAEKGIEPSPLCPPENQRCHSFVSPHLSKNVALSMNHFPSLCESFDAVPQNEWPDQIDSRWMLWILMVSVPLPYIANSAGWMSAELPATFFLSAEGFGVVADVVGSTSIERGFVNLLRYPSLLALSTIILKTCTGDKTRNSLRSNYIKRKQYVSRS
jgi:hypothetical protein